jgi:hypothetical protein
MSHISTDHSSINQHALQNKENIDTKTHGKLVTIKNSVYVKNNNIKDKKLSVRNIYINKKGIIEIYDKLPKEFLKRKQEDIPIGTRHVQPYDNYC